MLPHNHANMHARAASRTRNSARHELGRDTLSTRAHTQTHCDMTTRTRMLCQCRRRRTHSARHELGRDALDTHTHTHTHAHTHIRPHSDSTTHAHATTQSRRRTCAHKHTHTQCHTFNQFANETTNAMHHASPQMLHALHLPKNIRSNLWP